MHFTYLGRGECIWGKKFDWGDFTFTDSIVIIKPLLYDAERESPLTDFEFIFGKITMKIMFEKWVFLASTKTTSPHLENKNI